MLQTRAPTTLHATTALPPSTALVNPATTVSYAITVFNKHYHNFKKFNAVKIVICMCVCSLFWYNSDIDECMGVVCGNGGTCVNLIAAYRCDCAVGFNGQLCQNSK